MNLILLRPSDVVDSNGCLSASIVDKNTLNHLVNVLKVNVGTILRVGIVNSIKDYARVDIVGTEEITLKLSDKFRIESPSVDKPVVDLVVAIPRPKSLDKLLQYSSSLGVGNIDLVCSSRVEKSYLISHKMTREYIEESLLLGLQQGVDTLMPKVEISGSLWEYGNRIKNMNYPFKLVAHPNSENTLASLRLNEHVKGPILVAIGPEGGWLDRELEFFEKLGFTKFKIGDRILRTEVAAVAILSQLTLILNDSTLRNGLPPAVR